MDRRRAIIGSVSKQGGGLPSEYQEVEYIGTRNSAIIDTGVIGKTGITVDITFAVSSASYDGTLFGSRIGYNNEEFTCNCWNTSASIRIGNWQPGVISNLIAIGTITNFFVSVTSDNIVFNKDDNNIATRGGINVNSTCSIYLGAGNQLGGAYHSVSLDIYQCKIEEEGTVVRNYIPCYRKSDNEIGMYDLVSETFFTNAGSGAFIKGADV